MSTSGGSSGGDVTVVTAALNAAAVGTLFSAPTQLVAAPGANRMLVPISAMLEWKPAVDGFADAPNPAIFYGTPITANIVTSSPAGASGNPALMDSGAPEHRVAVVAMSADANQFDTSYALASTAYANKPLIVGTLTADPARAGPLLTTTLSGGGSGYAIGDTGTIDGSLYGSAAAYVIDTVAAITGAVLTYHLTSSGDGYGTIGNPWTTTAAGAQPGVGTGFEVNNTAIHAADGTLYVTCRYTTFTLH